MAASTSTQNGAPTAGFYTKGDTVTDAGGTIWQCVQTGFAGYNDPSSGSGTARFVAIPQNLALSSATPAAAGTNQATGTAITVDVNMVTGADGTKGVTLPASVVGKEITILNTNASNALKVYPPVSSQINALGVNASYSVAAGQEVVFRCSSTVLWYASAYSVAGLTATAAELNVLHSVTPGTVIASSGVVTDASLNLTGLNNLTMTGLLGESANDAVTANATQTQAAATALTKEINRVSVNATAGNGVRLPASAAGLTIVVNNDTVLPVQVYGAGTDTINGVATAVGVLQMQKSVVLYACTAVGNWLACGLGTGFNGSLETVSAVNALTAFAGGGQGSAVALTATINRVTVVATIGDSVKLPASAVGLILTVSNAAANALDVFPATGDLINANAANVALRINGGTTVSFWCTVAGTWHSSPTPVAASKYTTHTYSSATAGAGDLTGAAWVTSANTGATPGTLTTRTATQMFADAGNIQVGDHYKLRIVNAQGTGTLTLGAGAGVSITGTATIAANTYRDFDVVFTSATALTIQNEATGTFS